MSSRTEIQPDDTDELLLAAARRARLAPILSWAALAFGLGLVIVFLVEAGFFSALGPKPKSAPLTVEMPDQIAGAFARIGGFDRENQPYVITAKKGYQDKESAELVHLEDLTGTFHRKSSQPFELFSKTGLYHSKAKKMDLEGNVRIVEKGRFTATMAKAHVELQNKNLVSDVPVVVEMEAGTINANGLQVSNDGNNIKFLNGVKARFNQTMTKGDNPQ
ncbi:MAG TPA: LPS export ABC transporter periplasmic protein LptC [Aestuariivirga sp.]|nr:LPS export ABC transporter periplasmic protein LptC [Aestuariivirga sp.]